MHMIYQINIRIQNGILKGALTLLNDPDLNSSHLPSNNLHVRQTTGSPMPWDIAARTSPSGENDVS